MFELIHNFYLLAAGDFFLEFISRVDRGYLEKPAEISDGWLQQEFYRCVRHTSLSPSIEYISQHIRLKQIRSMTALDIWKSAFFVIDKEPNLLTIFSPVIMSKYEQIFSILMNMKTTSLLLERFWITQCSLSKELDLIRDPKRKETLLFVQKAINQTNLLRVKIQGFLGTLQNFYFLHVIDKHYQNLMTKMKEVSCFDDILTYHTTFVDDLCRNFFITGNDRGIKQCIDELMACANRFLGVQVGFGLRQYMML